MITEAQQRLYAAMSEERFRAQLVDMAGYGGWRHYHTYRSQRSPAGFPDEVFLRPDGYMVVAELKRHGNSATPAQEEWLADFATLADAVTLLQQMTGEDGPPRIQVSGNGVDRVWRPSDLPQIEEILLEGRIRKRRR